MDSVEFELGKISLANGGVLEMKDLDSVFPSEYVKWYWIKKLSKNKVLWKFENKGFYVFEPSWNAEKAAVSFMEHSGLKYYVWGMEAFNEWRLTEQMSQTVEIFNDEIRGTKTVNGTLFVFRKVKKQLLRDGSDARRFGKERRLLELLLIGENYWIPWRRTVNFAKTSGVSVKKISLAVAGLPDTTIQKMAGLLESAGFAGSDVGEVLSVMKGPKTKHFIRIFKQTADSFSKNPLSRTAVPSGTASLTSETCR